MRVLVVTNMYPTTAMPSAGVFVEREVRALQSLGGVDMRTIHVDTVGSTSRYVTQRAAVRKAIESYRPDVVHVHFGLSQLLVGRTDVPTVVTLHGSDLAVWWKRAITLRYLPRARAVILVARPLAEYLSGREKSVTVVPCGVPVQEFSPSDMAMARADLDLPEHGVIVGFPASPTRPEKGYRLFEEAVTLMPDVVPVVANVAPSRMREWLNAVDVVVCTSEREGSPVVTKEALCCGTRVVSTDVGDMRAQLEGFTGCGIVGDRSASAVVEATRLALGEDAPDASVAAMRFDIAKESSAVMSVYQAVVR